MIARSASLPIRRSIPRRLAVAGVATAFGLLLGALGPFGSYLNDGPVARGLYWVGATWAGLVFYGAGVAVVRKLAKPGTLSAWVLLAVSVLVASVPQTVLTRAIAFYLWPQLSNLGLSPGIWYGQVLMIGAVCVFGSALATRAMAARVAPYRAGTVSAGNSSLPDSVRPNALPGEPSTILALQMEDHYVRVHTISGSKLALMPLGRAIEALGSIEGLRTHRSWWVARNAVQQVEGTPRSMCLHLTNGTIAPVSRTAVADLRAAGWLGATGSL